jgi:hypothetical protein
MLGEVKRLMITQCGPVFMGIKPAALFPLRSALCLDCLSALLPGNINLLVLREIKNRPLVLVYDETTLEKTLSGGAIRLFLAGQGYSADDLSMPQVLRYLKIRFGINNFPHEVGLFLGYPLEDVTGFIRHKGQNYKFCGYWKVYGDVDGAKRLFRQYDFCRAYMERRSGTYTAIAGKQEINLR